MPNMKYNFSKYLDRLTDYLSSHGIGIDDNGMCNCFAHNDNTPSCKIADNKFHCFGCGVHGDIYDAVEIFESIKRKEKQFLFLKELFEKDDYSIEGTRHGFIAKGITKYSNIEVYGIPIPLRKCNEYAIVDFRDLDIFTKETLYKSTLTVPISLLKKGSFEKIPNEKVNDFYKNLIKELNNA